MLLDLLKAAKQAGSNKVLYKKITCVGGRGDNKTLNRLISDFNRISILLTLCVLWALDFYFIYESRRFFCSTRSE